MINAKTRLIALIGSPVEHSFGPVIHNAAFQHLGLNYAYLAFNVKNLKVAIEAMRELNFAGYSVTLPHKEKIIKYLDRVDDLAGKIKAVNTIVNKDGLLVGYNTDAAGAVNALKQETELKGKKVALIGAGGAARAIAFSLQEQNAETTIFNRTFERAKSLARAVGCNYENLQNLNHFKGDIIVNSTSVGMFPDVQKNPVEKKILKNYDYAFDAVYNPVETLFLKQAKQAGLKTISGLEMFLEQGLQQQKLWVGKSAPKELMREIVLKELSK